MRYLLAVIFSFSFLACSSQSHMQEGEEGTHTFSHEFDVDKYPEIIEKWTVRKILYSGFYNAFEFNVTFLNTSVREAIKYYQASYSQWTKEKTQSELAKSLDEANYDTTFFLSFFTPFPKDNNLSKKTSTWNIYLETNGRRYEATVVKALEEFSELIKLYPFHNRWSTAYMVKFRLPTSITQNQPSKFVITGPLGSAEASFDKL